MKTAASLMIGHLPKLIDQQFESQKVMPPAVVSSILCNSWNLELCLASPPHLDMKSLALQQLCITPTISSLEKVCTCLSAGVGSCCGAAPCPYRVYGLLFLLQSSHSCVCLCSQAPLAGQKSQGSPLHGPSDNSCTAMQVCGPTSY